MENVVMDAEGSLHQKPRDACIAEDTASTALGENGTRHLLLVGVRDWESLGASPSMISKGFCETGAEVMDAEAKGEGEIHPSKKKNGWDEFQYTSRLPSSPRIMIST